MTSLLHSANLPIALHYSYSLVSERLLSHLPASPQLTQSLQPLCASLFPAMATAANGHRSNGTVNDKGYQPEDELKNRSSDEAEKGEAVNAVSSKGSQNNPFGDETHSEVKYRTMHWWQAGMIMVAETISLGILSLPSAMATVGLVP